MFQMGYPNMLGFGFNFCYVYSFKRHVFILFRIFLTILVVLKICFFHIFSYFYSTSFEKCEVSIMFASYFVCSFLAFVTAIVSKHMFLSRFYLVSGLMFNQNLTIIPGLCAF